MKIAIYNRNTTKHAVIGRTTHFDLVVHRDSLGKLKGCRCPFTRILEVFLFDGEYLPDSILQNLVMGFDGVAIFYVEDAQFRIR